jgi:hypothetical protein
MLIFTFIKGVFQEFHVGSPAIKLNIISNIITIAGLVVASSFIPSILEILFAQQFDLQDFLFMVIVYGISFFFIAFLVYLVIYFVNELHLGKPFAIAAHIFTLCILAYPMLMIIPRLATYSGYIFNNQYLLPEPSGKIIKDIECAKNDFSDFSGAICRISFDKQFHPDKYVAVIYEEKEEDRSGYLIKKHRIDDRFGVLNINPNNEIIIPAIKNYFNSKNSRNICVYRILDADASGITNYLLGGRLTQGLPAQLDSMSDGFLQKNKVYCTEFKPSEYVSGGE